MRVKYQDIRPDVLIYWREKMRIYLDPGHGAGDPGAVKYVNERDAALVIGLACRAYLEAAGVSVRMSRVDNDRTIDTPHRAKEANGWKADYYVSIHLNAGGGDGEEIYHSISYGEGRELAADIEYQIKQLGQNSRGLKTRTNADGSDHFNVIRLTNMPAVIVECAFVDNKKDSKIIDEVHEQEKFGYAIAKGILERQRGTKRIYKTLATLNLHSTAAISGEIMHKVPKGTLIAGKAYGSWIKVTYKGTTGYIRLKTSTREYSEVL